MGIFTRMRDIMSSNINAMLDKAEDPEKLIRLMIQEMEDTLVEVKASCAGAMAAKKKLERQLEEARAKVSGWSGKAQLAIDKGREDLAREALYEKKRYTERVTALEQEQNKCDDLIGQYKTDIMKLEEKLSSAREKQRVLVQRHIHAQQKKKAEEGIRRYDTSDAVVRFEKFESKIDRMESDADLVNYARKPTLEEQFARLEEDEDIEIELEQMKGSKSKGTTQAKPEEKQ